MRYPLITLLLLTISLAAAPAGAVWDEGGNYICDEDYTQRYPMMVPDGDGNTIITWEDYRSASNADIYAQKFDSYGNPLWTSGGIPIAASANSESNPEIVSDGAGGAIILWSESVSGTYYLKAQRIDGEGTALWPSAATLLAQTSSIYGYKAIPAGLWGMVCTWYSDISGNFDIYAQRVGIDGTVMWGTSGTAICSDSGNQQQPKLCPDGTGGAIVSWYDSRSGNWDVYARRIDYNGSVYGTSGGIAICTETGNQLVTSISSDGNIGAIITWTDSRSGYNDIYAQRVNSSVSPQWTAGGIAICTASGSQGNGMAEPDGNGNIIFAWTDERSGNDDIYAQKTDFNGTTAWTADGVAVCTQPSQQWSPMMIVTETGNAIFAWADPRLGTYNMYAQMIDQNGSTQCESDGVLLSPGLLYCEYANICSDGEGGAIVTWNTASGSNDIMAQRIERNGYWGYPAPVIADVRDIPGDQGGSVDLAWHGSRIDPWPDMTISHYTVWRAISHPDAVLMASGGARVIDSASELPAVEQTDTEVPKKDVIRRETVGGTTYFWKMISTIESYYLDSYSEVAETLFDSTSVSNEYHYFQVIAHTTTPSAFWVSEPDSGYSVDNLAPVVPLGFAGVQSYTPEGIQLTWEPNDEPDLSGYRIYRGLTETFEPGTGNLLTSIPDTTTFDDTWSWDSGYYYKLAAVDIHGNESGYSLLAPVGVTGEDIPGTPQATYLSQNYPNPFNPSTTILFGLTSASRVSLKVYDTAGRLVRVVLDEQRGAGHYTEHWDGMTASGDRAASGVYFYRLINVNQEITKKMILLR